MWATSEMNELASLRVNCRLAASMRPNTIKSTHPLHSNTHGVKSKNKRQFLHAGDEGIRCTRVVSGLARFRRFWKDRQWSVYLYCCIVSESQQTLQWVTAETAFLLQVDFLSDVAYKIILRLPSAFLPVKVHILLNMSNFCGKQKTAFIQKYTFYIAASSHTSPQKYNTRCGTDS